MPAADPVGNNLILVKKDALGASCSGVLLFWAYQE